MNVLVAGGAGYIGSHAVKLLVEAGHRVVAVDNLFRGHARRSIAGPPSSRSTWPTPRPWPSAPPAQGRVRDAFRRPGLRRRIGRRAAGLLRQQHGRHDQPAAGDEGGGREADGLQLDLRHLRRARVDAHRRDHAAGADQSVRLVEVVRGAGAERLRAPPSPVRLRRAAVLQRGRLGGRRLAGRGPRSGNASDSGAAPGRLGPREKVTVFGTDYPTPDGTCIRDYIHVEDLCAAHIAAMEALRPGDARFYNLGIGRGYSVKEVIEAARRVTGMEIPRRVRPAPARRPGGPVCRRRQDPPRAGLVGRLHRDRPASWPRLELVPESSPRVRGVTAVMGLGIGD